MTYPVSAMEVQEALGLLGRTRLWDQMVFPFIFSIAIGLLLGERRWRQFRGFLSLETSWRSGRRL